MTWEQFFLGCFAVRIHLQPDRVSRRVRRICTSRASSRPRTSHAGARAWRRWAKFNFGTIAAFLTWFGGAGYILSSWGRVRIWR